jgi:DNA ligase-1
VGTRDLVTAATESADVPPWLFDASYEAVGDLAETIALLLPPPAHADDASLAAWVAQDLLPLAGLPSDAVRARLRAAWDRLDRDGRFVYGKLITGAFRVGAARQLVYRALAEAASVPVTEVAHRLIGEWTPSVRFFEQLRGIDDAPETPSHHPYPFFLAHPLEDDPATLGDIAAWQVEWKWDGIRAQLVRRGGGASLWSRGEELVNDAFPDIVAAASAVPDGTVVDGEILAWSTVDERPLEFAALQKRLNRKAPAAKLLHEIPAVLVAYDVLEQNGGDIRALPLAERRARLAALLPGVSALRLSPRLHPSDWPALSALRLQSREHHAEGVMLKRLDSAYGVGRVRGPWWKWKIDPYTVDAVRSDAELVPFAKAYSGLSDAEIRDVDAWVRSHTLERFGPVRRVEPQLVFELAFEAIQASTRHKSGVAVRFPRILRWRTDKPASEADTLEHLKSLAAGRVP